VTGSGGGEARRVRKDGVTGGRCGGGEPPAGEVVGGGGGGGERKKLEVEDYA
jgi:hypothetical protein